MGGSRAGSGRKVIPFVEKKARGTFRQDRVKDSPEASGKLPVPPSMLNKRAKQIFQHLVKNRLSVLGIASASHTELLSMVSAEMEQLERLDKFIEENGFTFRKITGYDDEGKPFHTVKPWPEVSMQKELRRHVHTILCGEFGLSPAAAQKVPATGKNEKKNPKDRFFK
jgi:P27 family predicted phage terminase small subunit